MERACRLQKFYKCKNVHRVYIFMVVCIITLHLKNKKIFIMKNLICINTVQYVQCTCIISKLGIILEIFYT